MYSPIIQRALPCISITRNTNIILTSTSKLYEFLLLFYDVLSYNHTHLLFDWTSPANILSCVFPTQALCQRGHVLWQEVICYGDRYYCSTGELHTLSLRVVSLYRLSCSNNQFHNLSALTLSR